MSKILLILSVFITLSYADIWKKMFHVERVESSPQAQYEYGFKVGYDEAMNGQPVIIQPSYDSYGQGYIDGRSKALNDIRRMNGEYLNQPTYIIVNPNEQIYDRR